VPTDTLEAPVAQPTEVETPSGSSPSPTAEASPPASATGAQDAPRTPAAEEKPDPLAGIDAHDPEVLYERHPGLKRWVDSKAGELTSKNVTKAEAEIRTKVEQEFLSDPERINLLIEDRRYREAIKEGDLVTVGEIAAAREARTAQQAAQSQSEAATEQLRSKAAFDSASTIGTAIWQAVENDLPEAARKELTKDWGHKPENIAEYAVAVVKALAAAGVEKGIAERLPKVKAELEAALSQDGNAQRLAQEPTPDTRGGSNSGSLSDADFIAAYADGRSNDHARYRALRGTR
jgi:hypothetical protein